MGKIKVNAKDPARIDVKPVAEPKRGVLVKPAEKLFLRSERWIRWNWLHSSPWRTLAIPPPEFVVEVEAAFLARTIEKCPCDVYYFRVFDCVENLFASVNRSIMIAKEILL